MFKLFEKDKCVTVQLDLSNGHLDDAKTIVPGDLLIDDDDGVRKAENGDTIAPATVGLYYLAMDYYANTLNAAHAMSANPPTASSVMGSGKLAAVPIMENFTAIIPIKEDLSKGDLLTIEDGLFTAADTSDLAIAVVTEDNNYNAETSDAVDTKITTFMYRHEIAAE
jgi:hypothetical protein